MVLRHAGCKTLVSTSTVNLVDLKNMAVKFLPPTSTLRTLLVSGSESRPRDVADAKVKVFLRLLYQELADGYVRKPIHSSN